MSAGDLKTDGLKGNNFPWQLKMLLGQQCACDQLTEINANTDDVEFLLSAILTTLQANTEYEAKFVVDTCNGDTVYLEVRVWNPDTSTWGPITYYLPGSDTPVIPPGAATPGCLIYTDPSGVLALILGAIQAGNLILTDIETNTGDTVTELQNLLALYTAGQSACANSLSVTLCTEQGLSLSAIENNTGAIATSTASIDTNTTSIPTSLPNIDISTQVISFNTANIPNIDITTQLISVYTANIDTTTAAISVDTAAISADTTTIVSQLNSQVKTPVIKRISGITLGISVQIQSISIACPLISTTSILVSTDGTASFVGVRPGETVYYDAGALNNYFAANLFYIDTLGGGEALITYII